jgi:hypothetical protein
MKHNKPLFRAPRRKTQSTPTSRVVRDRETTPARTYVLGPAGWLVIGIMALAVLVAVIEVIATRGAM